MVQFAAASYDVFVGGLDEVSARAVLMAMQDRLARDPASALGLIAGASADEVRSAFLRLTKQFHPVRFGRMALDIQKLSNEVFLALRAAHDTLARTGRRQSGQMVTVRGPAQTASQPPLQPISQPLAPTPLAPPPPPVPGALSQNARTTQQIPVRPARVFAATDGTERPPRSLTPGTGIPVVSGGERPAPRSPTPALGVPIVPGGERPAPRSPTPALGVPVVPSRQSGQLALRPSSPPATPVRKTGGYPIVAPPAVTARDEAVAVDLLQRQQWDQARSVLQQLSARDPSSRRIRALIAYARGREAQLDRRLDDARVELQTALELDPELQLAKTALTELFSRRK